MNYKLRNEDLIVEAIQYTRNIKEIIKKYPVLHRLRMSGGIYKSNKKITVSISSGAAIHLKYGDYIVFFTEDDIGIVRKLFFECNYTDVEELKQCE